MGDTHPLSSSENFVLMDVADEDADAADLNSEGTRSDRFRERKDVSGIFSPYNVNGRLVVIALALVCFILSLALFIGTVVVVYGSGSGPVQSCPSVVTSSQSESERDQSIQTNKVLEPSTTTQRSITDFNERSVTVVNGKNVAPGTLVYSEEFNSFNTTAWEHVTHESVNQFYYYVNTRNNSYVSNGVLYLKPTFTADAHGEDYVANGTLFLGKTPNEKCAVNDASQRSSALCWKTPNTYVHPIMSPMITSQEAMTFTYGRLEIRAKMPSGDWVEPLITLQPFEENYGDGLLNGQIQVIDTRGNRKLFNSEGVNVGSEQTCPDIRFGSSKDKRIIYDCLSTHPDQGFDREFHTYEVEWSPEGITLKIDGEGIVAAPGPRPSMFKRWSKGREIKVNPWASAKNKKMAPFDRPFYIALGVNVGGTHGFFSDDYSSSYQKPWKNDDPSAPKTFWEGRANWSPSWENDAAALQIDYIRLYSLNTTVTSD